MRWISVDRHFDGSLWPDAVVLTCRLPVKRKALGNRQALLPSTRLTGPILQLRQTWAMADAITGDR
jgi:hypothetical protein